MYTFYFKVIYTTNTFYLSFSPNDTLKDLADTVLLQLLEDGLLRRGNTPSDSIELIETGQYNNVNGRDPELAPSMTYPRTSTLRELFGHKWKTTAFYIKLFTSGDN